MNEFQSQTFILAVDRIFSSSAALSGAAVVHFFSSLCKVSLEEVDEQPKPRMFSLQKVVELTTYNMNRIRLEWTPIWHGLQAYFNTVGCHTNQNVATFAVDSLRQLAMKFLEREELAHYHTQNEFLKPFEHIIKQNRMFAIRDFVLKSVEQMIRARHRNLRSGWRSIFVVLSRYESLKFCGFLLCVSNYTLLIVRRRSPRLTLLGRPLRLSRWCTMNTLSTRSARSMTLCTASARLPLTR